MSTVDKMKNAAQQIEGDVKQRVGGATKDESLQAEGKKDEAVGNLKQAGEKVKDAFR